MWIALKGGKPRYHHGNRQPCGRVTSPFSLGWKRPLREGAGESSKGAPLASFSAGRFRPDPLEGFVLLFRSRRKDWNRAPPCLSTFQLFHPATGVSSCNPSRGVSPQVCMEVTGRVWGRLWPDLRVSTKGFFASGAKPAYSSSTLFLFSGSACSVALGGHFSFPGIS